jgi:LysM repeat protein
VPVVLTRRGRIVVTAFLVLVAAGLLLMLPRVADATGVGVSPSRDEQNLSQVVVRPGDTLWSIAARSDRSADPRLVIQRISDLNALAGTGIVPGQRLWMPKN